MMRRPWRTWLYVPATRSDRVGKALASPADCVVVDLEDSVVHARKQEARELTVALLQSPPPKPIVVRVNDLRGPWGLDDLAAVARGNVAGVRIPKATEPDLIREAAAVLRSAGCAAPLYLLVESALGLERAYDLARSDEQVGGLALGEADLRADLRVEADEGLCYARSRIVAAARAAGLPPPVQSVHTVLHDIDGLRESTRLGRRLGFFGRSVIHPSQVPIVHGALTPTPAEVAAARELVDALDEAELAGTGALVLPDGRFVDLAVAEAARWTLALAENPPGGED